MPPLRIFQEHLTLSVPSTEKIPQPLLSSNIVRADYFIRTSMKSRSSSSKSLKRIGLVRNLSAPIFSI